VYQNLLVISAGLGSPAPKMSTAREYYFRIGEVKDAG
jgi:hypothetical protein